MPDRSYTLLLVGPKDRTRAQAAPLGEHACEHVSVLSSETPLRRRFDAAALLLDPGHSPYGMAYRLYLEGVPVRVGRSREFGGGVLSHCLSPDEDDATVISTLLAALAGASGAAA